MIDYKGLEEAMEYLAFTDEEYGDRKGELEKAEILRKRVRARIFLGTGGNNEERKAKAEVAAESIAADDHYIECLTLFEKLRAKRQRSESFIEVWRSVEASRRKN